ncbi:nucleotide exchange factor GrpE, partial [Acinetobacter baumannii]|uniref:nucleotide exchange factor GrpE n=1 Tax=Acinetobacter baumannii TaxID=470 RepID=UPI003C731576
MRKFGVEVIADTNVPLDPNVHQAIAMVESEDVTAGNVLAPPKRWQGTFRDGVSWLLNYLPPVKRYFLEMRFRP